MRSTRRRSWVECGTFQEDTFPVQKMATSSYEEEEYKGWSEFSMQPHGPGPCQRWIEFCADRRRGIAYAKAIQEREKKEKEERERKELERAKVVRESVETHRPDELTKELIPVEIWLTGP